MFECAFKVKWIFENIFLYHRFAKWKTRKQNLFRKWKESSNASIESIDSHSDGSDVDDALSQSSADTDGVIEDEEGEENSSHAVVVKANSSTTTAVGDFVHFVHILFALARNNNCPRFRNMGGQWNHSILVCL